MGDPVAVGVGSSLTDPVPLRPVRLPPAWVDVTEFTVGRFRELVLAGRVSGTPDLVAPEDRLGRYCTWRGPNDARNDALPVNCVRVEVAAEACAAVGGRLLREARFEHAARGRGRAQVYPWGDGEPRCCTASFSRRSGVAVPARCAGEGPEAAGAHAAQPECGGVGDVSRDGLLDLGGSVTEVMADRLVPYDGECWRGAPLLEDPLCADADVTVFTARGGNWSSGAATMRSALRSFVAGNGGPAVGFRCEYEDR